MIENRSVSILLLTLVICMQSTVKASVPKVDSITPNCGSINGGTRITIYGSSFARNFFNFGEGNEELGSRVQLTNLDSTECELHVDGSHETQIMCYTKPMREGEYMVRVSVDGIPVAEDRYCNNPNSCKFRTSQACTPTITEIVPFSGMPGDFLVLYGNIRTTKYGANEPDEFQDTILRVYYGNQKCELRDAEKDEMYGIFLEGSRGWLKCKTEGTYISNIDISYLISNEYGRSQPVSNILHVRRMGPSMYQAFTEISGISQSKGSTAGGTRLTITGQHFDETNSDAQVFVGGEKCEVVKPISDTAIVCITPADASAGVNDYPGGRGLYSYFHYNSTDQDAFTYEDANVRHTDSSHFNDTSFWSYVHRMRGYFMPPASGDYRFYTESDGGSRKFFMSNGSDDQHKTQMGSETVSLNADTPYYIEIQHSSSNEEKRVRLKARLDQTDLSADVTGLADHEVQTIRFTSEVTREILTIDVETSGTAGAVESDVQTMTISGDPNAYFAIGLNGIFTAPMQLSQITSGGDILTELVKLPTLHGIDVDVQFQTVDTDFLLIFISNSPQGAISLYSAKVVGDDDSALTFSVSRDETGTPSLETFTLTMDDIPTTPISVGATDSEVKDALEDLFAVPCHPNLYSGVVIGFETEQSWMNGRRSDDEPFCGRYYAKNPLNIYHRGNAEGDRGLTVSPSANTFMCFAYKGLGQVKFVRVRYTYVDNDDEPRDAWAYIQVNNDNPAEWRFHCEDIYALLSNRISGYGIALWYMQAVRMNGGEDLLIDHLLFNKKRPLDENLLDFGIYNMRGRQAQPNGYFINTVTVNEISPSQYEIELSPHHCGHDLPEFGVAVASSSGSVHTISNSGEVVVSIYRNQTASPPIGGTFKVMFKGDMSPSPIPVTVEIDTENIVSNLATTTVGFTEVTGTGTCSDFSYKVTMVSLPGDQPLMEIDASELTGTEVEVTVTTNNNGGLWLNPIMGDLLRTYHTKPQVLVYINDVPTRCSDPTACTFEWSSEFTPTVTSISPSTGSHGDTVRIEGTGFDDSNLNNNEVIIGTTPCTVTFADATNIDCTINNGPTGAAEVQAYVAGKGLSSSNVEFTYVTGVDSYSPGSGSVQGGTLLTFSGYGFTSDAVVTLDSNECVIETIDESQITCKTPQADSESDAANVTVTITQPGSTLNIGEFTYDPAIAYTPVISTISATTGNVWGGDPLTIDGQGFGNVEMPVTLGGAELDVSSYSDTLIVATLPALSHGSYQLLVDVDNKGYADLRLNSIPDISYTFQVNSMTPNFGSMYGGTDVLISGEGFSTDEDAFDIKIGNHECDIETVSSTSIKCRIADTGSHHFVFGNGTHKFYGVGYAWDKDPVTVEVGDYVTWSWETPFYVSDVNYGVHQTESPSSTKNMPGGFTSGSNNRKGSFTHRFTRTGTYYYWTSYLDTDNILYFRGSVTVTPLSSSVEVLSLEMHGYEASYNTEGTRVIDSTDCFPNFSPLINCTDSTTLTPISSKFNFEFRKCYSPYINGLSRTNGTTDDTITLSGGGFGIINCQSQVTFDGAACETTAITPTSVDFQILGDDSPPINAPHAFELRITNLGYALNTMQDERELNFVLLPWVENIATNEGSKMGGTQLTISGSGFLGEIDDVSVQLQYLSCNVEFVNYTQIQCVTDCAFSPDGCFLGSMPVYVGIKGVEAECLDSVCNFTTVEEKTAVVSDVDPDTVSADSTDITLTGDRFGTVAEDLTVTIGGEDCSVSGAVTNTNFICSVGRLPVGNNKIHVYVSNNGKAATTLTVNSPKVADISSPSESSIHGGAILTLIGNGFVNEDTSVTVGDEDCVITGTSFVEVTCIVPAHPEGDEDVIVTSNGIQYDALTLTYSSDSTPNVASIDPSEGESGDEVTITGSGFKPSSTDPTVKIGGVECPVTVANDTSITCTVGTKQTGIYEVQVLVPSKGYSDKNVQFTYQLGDFTLYPLTGSTNGGQALTVSGSGFLEDATVVTICGEECPHISVSASEYVCSTPKSSAGACQVVVTVEGVTKSEDNAYTYDSSLVSTITSVSPRRGGTGGGTLVTITGTNFGSNIEDVKVTIADVNCTVQTVNDTDIVCRTGQAKSTDTFVSVQINAWGEAVQVDASFEYIDLWSSPYTWGGNDPPEVGSFVTIPSDTKILLDIDTPVLSILLIEGELIFDEKDIELQAEVILINGGGNLQIGSPEEPFPPEYKAIITLHGHVRSPEMPIYGTKTVAVREGTLNLFGAPVSHTWTHLRSTAAAGSSVLELKHSVDWHVGDEIVIATTGPRHSQIESEVHVIAAISSDGHTLTLESPLSYEHIAISGTFGSVEVDFAAEVGRLTRNVLVRGYRNTVFDHKIEACPEGFNTGEFAIQTCFQGRFGEELGSDQFGAQIMIHSPHKDSQVAQAHIENVEITHAGQAFRLGRYPVHIHLNGNMSKSYVRRCSIHHSFNRAVNVHGSHYVMVEHNVVYNIMGGAFFLEDGNEIGNTFQYNLAIFVRSSTSLRNDDITPASIWVTNPDNIIRHNAAAGGTHFGVWYRMHRHPDGPGFDKTICPQAAPLAEYRNNTAHSMGWFGLWIFEMYIPRQGGSCSSSAPHQVARFHSLFAWNCEKGAEGVNVGAVQFHQFVLVNNEKAGYEGKLLVENPPQFDNEIGPGIFDSVIVAHYGSLRGTPTSGGIVLPYFSGFKADLIDFYNFDQPKIAAFRWTRIDGTCGSFCGGFTTHTANLTFIDSPNKVAYGWESEGVLHDLDGSLTGSPGYSVAPCTPSFDSDECKGNRSMSVGKPGCICTDAIKLVRFSFNKIAPESLNYKDAIFTTIYGSSYTPWAKKRITHKDGWAFILMANTYYEFSFENADHISNISYTSTFYDFDASDFVVFTQFMDQKPDIFKLGDGNNYEMSGELSGDDVEFGDWHYFNQSLTFAISHPSRIKREALTTQSNINVNFEATRCYFRGCEPPKPPIQVTEIPPYKEYWSDANTWINLTADGLEPESMDDLTIPRDRWIIVDKAIPPLGKLVIEGGLQFESNSTRDIVLEADYIYITGRLIIGWSEEDPYLGNVVVRLRGSHTSPVHPAISGPTLGSKFIAAFGGLQIHGVDRGITKTFLATTVMPGSNEITVTDTVAWEVDDDIFISTTEYNAWQTEVFRINAISGNSITLNDTTRYRHIAITEEVNGQVIELGASVGLLTRNIKIVGDEYPKMEEESFGARVIVGQTSDSNGFHSGFAQLSNVEFYHTGQEGFTDNYDARFSLTYSGVTTSAETRRYSYVRKNTFHSGYNTAVGVFGTDDLEISDNVVYHTVGPAIRTESRGTQITGNLVALSLWPGSYQDRREASNLDYDGAIDAPLAEDLILSNNIVVGAERAGFRVTGQACSTLVENYWVNNMVQASLAGVAKFYVDPDVDAVCALFHGFKVWKNYDFGIYYQGKRSVEIRNNIFVENGVGLFPFIVEPPSVHHEYDDKIARIDDNIWIGKTSTFNETEDKVFTNDANIKFSEHARSHAAEVPCGKIGIVMTTFTSSSNKAPRKPFIGVISYQAIKGVTKVTGNTFVNFGACTGGYDHAIATNSANDDGIHPMQISDTTLVNVDHLAQVLYHRPNVKKVNPADCVDMDCDGLKKCMISDLDGSFMGSKGTILPNSAYEWDGNPQHGLGDYRIPSVLLTTSGGTKIDVNTFAPNKGIFKTDECTWISEWNAFSCGDEFDWRMLIIESMDSDTETRRLSPVAIYHPSGYIDLINGPQDHGWCNGYTCQRRLSTFQAIVALDEPFDIILTSTNPKVMRYMLLNSGPDECVRLGMWYHATYRLELAVDGTIKLPKNGFISESGAFRLRRQETTHQYMPVIGDDNGDYFVSHLEQMVFWIQCGGDSVITVTMRESFIVAFTLPAMTEAEFFGEKIIENLAAFLQIDPKKVRIVNIVEDTSTSGRRKRQADETTFYVEISDQPGEENTIDYDTVVPTMINSIQLGIIDEVINSTIIYTSIIEPLDLDVNGTAPAESVTLQRVGQLVLDTHPVGNTIENEYLQVQPKLKVTDTNGDVVTLLGSASSGWAVEASIKSGDSPTAVLVGETTLNFTEGWANFTDLAISRKGSFIIEFNIVSPPEATNFSLESLEVTVAGRNLGPKASLVTTERLTKSPVELDVFLVDKDTNSDITDIEWADHIWTATAAIYEQGIYTGSLSGTLTVTFDAGLDKGIFDDLQFSEPGICPVLVTITDDRGDYEVSMVVYIDVITSEQNSIVVAESPALEIQLPIIFDNDTAPIWTAKLRNHYSNNPEMRIVSTSYKPGSLIVTLNVEATVSGLNDTLLDMCSDIEGGTTFSLDNITVSLSSHLTVDGITYYGVSCAKVPANKDDSDDDDLDTVYIIIIAVLSGVIFIIICVFIAYKCYSKPKSHMADAQTAQNRGLYARSDLLNDALSRDSTFASLKSRPYTPPVAPMSTSKSFDLSMSSPSPTFRSRGKVSPEPLTSDSTPSPASSAKNSLFRV